MRRKLLLVALIVLLFFLLSACGSSAITKIDPDTKVCYMHWRQWVVLQFENDVYRVDPEQCRP